MGVQAVEQPGQGVYGFGGVAADRGERELRARAVPRDSSSKILDASAVWLPARIVTRAFSPRMTLDDGQTGPDMQALSIVQYHGP